MGRPLGYDDLGRLESAGDARVSPDGRLVAWVRTSEDLDADRQVTELHLVGRDGTDRVLTAGPDDGAPRWSPSGDRLAFVRPRDGVPAVWVLPMDGGEPLPVTRGGAVVGFAWSPDGTRLAVLATGPTDAPPVERDAAAPVVVDRLLHRGDGSGLRGDRRIGLHVVDLEADLHREVVVGDGDVTDVAWTPDGEAVVVATADHDRWDLDPHGGLRLVPLDDGPSRDLLPGFRGRAAAPVVTADGRHVVFASVTDVRDGGLTHLWRVPLAGGEVVRVAADVDRNVMVGGPGYPGGRPALAGDGEVVFCVRDRGAVHVLATPVDGGTSRVVVGGSVVVSSLTVAADGRTLGCTVAGPGSTPDVHLVTEGGSERLTATSAELLAEVVPAPVDERTFTSSDGTEVHGWIVGTAGAGVDGPRPLLLDVHGGPHNAWGPALDTVHLYHQVLAAQGWVVLCLNSRGSDGYGEAFWSALRGGWGRADLDDWLGPVDELVAEGVADPDRLAVTGYSYGGYATCWLTTQTDRFAAAVPGGIVCDLRSFTGTADVGPQMAWPELGLDPTGDLSLLDELSPLTYVDAVTTPTLVLHGAADERCPVGQADQWFAALRLREREARMVLYPGASHLYVLNGRPSHRRDHGERLVDWVTRHTVR